MTDNLQTIPAYVYKITCKPTGQYYFGFRAANIHYNRLPKDDLWIKYFSSSRHVNELIARYGKDNFDYCIMFENPDVDAVFWAEQDYIAAHIQDKLCINRSYQDKVTGTRAFHKFGIPHPEYIRQSMSEKRKGIPKGPSKLRGRKTNRPPSIKTIAATKGTRWYNNGTKEVRSVLPPEGYTLGKLSRGKPTGRKGLPSGRKGVSNIALKNRPKTKASCVYCRRVISVNTLKFHQNSCKARLLTCTGLALQ